MRVPLHEHPGKLDSLIDLFGMLAFFSGEFAQPGAKRCFRDRGANTFNTAIPISGVILDQEIGRLVQVRLGRASCFGSMYEVVCNIKKVKEV